MRRYLLFLVLVGALADSLTAQTITINSSDTYQEIDGFGGMNHTTWVRDLNDDQRQKVFGNEPWNMGLSILRVHVDPNSGRFNEAVPTAVFATSKGAKVLASPWDPPEELIDRSSGEPVLPPANYGAYADHLNSFISLMENAGVPLYAISVQNEPDIGEWTSWTQNEIFNFVKDYGHLITTRLLAAESFNFKHSYTDPILNDAAASENLDIVGGHIYGNGLYDYPLAREKGKPVWMTEHLTGSDSPSMNNWSLAMSFGKEINDCMEANFNAYIWWYIRRFYSLIRDDGNISEKGYVMSHYSKFIRPGSVRVGAAVSGADGVNATAFTTDSSMTIVVVNRTSTDRELSFILQNADHAAFSHYASTSGNYLVNKGEVDAGSGSFSLTMASNSINTITSLTGIGGKAGNVLPTASLGEDTLLMDHDGDRYEQISLNADSCYDTDGEIVNYSWALNGEQYSTETEIDLNLPVGDHAISLAVTDNDGGRKIAKLHITVMSLFSTALWFEPECEDPGANWEVNGDSDASNLHYVNTPDGVEHADAPSELEDDLIRIDFEILEESLYTVWGRVIAASASDDSFWIRMDDGEWINWNGIPTGTDWHWDDVHSQSDDQPVDFDLAAGDHSLYICAREDGARLDKILISNNGEVPEGAGDFAGSCTFEIRTTALWYEAECSFMGANWSAYGDQAASNGIYVISPEDVQPNQDAPTDMQDFLMFTFPVTEETDYHIWARVLCPSTAMNSFWVSINNGAWVNWSDIPVAGIWTWVKVQDAGESDPVSFDLIRGTHVLNIAYNEPGALIDKVLITNTNMVPEATGGEAGTCEVDVLGVSGKDEAGIQVYPNPTAGFIRLETEQAFYSLELLSASGLLILQKSYSSPVFRDELHFELPSGLYLIRVRDQGGRMLTRQIVVAKD